MEANKVKVPVTIEKHNDQIAAKTVNEIVNMEANKVKVPVMIEKHNSPIIEQVVN